MLTRGVRQGNPFARSLERLHERGGRGLVGEADDGRLAHVGGRDGRAVDVEYTGARTIARAIGLHAQHVETLVASLGHQHLSKGRLTGLAMDGERDHSAFAHCWWGRDHALDLQVEVRKDGRR